MVGKISGASVLMVGVRGGAWRATHSPLASGVWLGTRRPMLSDMKTSEVCVRASAVFLIVDCGWK